MRAPTLVLSLALPSLAAQESTLVIAAAQQLGDSMDVVSGSWGVDFVSAYYLRGFLQESSGTIAQPHFALDYDLGQGVGFSLGSWNSLHSDDTGSGGTGQVMWYQSDFYASVDARIASCCEAAATYRVYHSPNGRFDTVEEVAFGATIIDSGVFGDSLRLRPSILVAFELDGQVDRSSHVGVYAELAVAPVFELAADGASGLQLTLPATLGLSLDDYYQDSTGADSLFGYLDFGAVLTAQLAFLPSRIGIWEASLGVHALFLGDAAEARNDGDTFEVVGSFGMRTTF